MQSCWNSCALAVLFDKRAGRQKTTFGCYRKLPRSTLTSCPCACQLDRGPQILDCQSQPQPGPTFHGHIVGIAIVAPCQEAGPLARMSPERHAAYDMICSWDTLAICCRVMSLQRQGSARFVERWRPQHSQHPRFQCLASLSHFTPAQTASVGLLTPNAVQKKSIQQALLPSFLATARICLDGRSAFRNGAHAFSTKLPKAIGAKPPDAQGEH